MKNLFNQADTAEILDRLDQLTPQSPRGWGKMTVSQMLAHCSISLEVASGKAYFPMVFMGRIFGPLVKPSFLNEKPIRKGVPTDKHFIIRDEPDFAVQKQRLKSLVSAFAEGGPGKVTTQPHSFFGKMNPEEWSRMMYKHLDHHFTQFGV